MRKKFTFLLTLFLVSVGVGVAQTGWYKPGERKATFTAGDKVFIYNTAKPDGQDRTGFLYTNDSPGVQLGQQKPFNAENFYNGNAYVWTIKSVSGPADGVYELQLTTAAGTYISVNGNPLNTGAQTLYVAPFASCDKRDKNVKTENADGTGSALPTTDDAVWAVYNNNTCWNGNEGSFTTWSDAHPYAFYAVVDVTEEHDAFQSPLTAALGELGKKDAVTESKFPLTTTNLTSNTESAEGAGIAGLLDGNADTYFHSPYSGSGKADPQTYHNLMVDLGEDNAAEIFRFGYTSRNSSYRDEPSVIRIWGSNDGENFEEVTLLTSEKDGLVNGAVLSYESAAIEAQQAYRYFRFDVEATHANRKYNGYPFFTLSEFHFNTLRVNVGDGASADNALKIHDVLRNGEKLASAYLVTESEVTGYTELVNRVGNVAGLDFLSDPAAPKYYAIQMPKCANAPYWTLYYHNGGKVKLEATENPGNDANKYWYFTLTDDYRIKIVPMAEPGTTMGHVGNGNGAAKITNMSSTDGWVGDEYEYAATNDTDAPAGFKLPGNNMYVSVYGGAGNYMGLYSDLSDGGSHMKLVPLGTPSNVDDIVAVQAALNALPDYATFGDGFGQYSCSDKEAYDAARAALQNISAADMAAVRASLAGLAFTGPNLPATGSFYRFKGFKNNKYMTSTVNADNTGRLNMKEVTGVENTPETVFYWDEVGRLVALTDGTCLGKFVRNTDNWKMFLAADADNCGAVEILHKMNDDGAYFNILPSAGRYIYNANATVDCGGSDADNGYRWQIEKVDWLPVRMNVEAKYGTLYSPVNLGKGYNADRVKAYAGTVSEDETCLELVEITGNIPANTPVVLEYMQDIEENGCVYLPVGREAAEYTGENALSGKLLAESVASASVLTLQRLDGETGFYTYTGETLGGFKAYIDGATAPGVNALRFYTGDTTGVDGVPTARKKEMFYDLNGRPVAYPSKGIYVTASGKKVLFK